MTVAPELRKDPILNRWVLVPGQVEPRGAACPVCDAVAAGVLAEARVAVVNHPAPVLDRRRAVDRTRSGGDLFTTMTGAGEHELIVEDARHGARAAELEVAQLGEVLAMWRARLLFFRQDNRFRHMAVVQRQGSRAGAIADHACSEAFALPLVPPSVKEKILGIQGYHRRTGACVYCDIVRHERQDKARRVAESMRHIAIAPFASRSPFELMLLPKGHHFDFAASADEDLADLAALLSEVLVRLERSIPDLAYTLYVQTAPPDMGADLQQFHWHLELCPRIAAPEAVGGVLDVNPVSPEDAARILRDVSL